MSREIEITIREGEFLDVDYRKMLTRLALLLMSDLCEVKRGFRIATAPQPREDGPFYQLQVIGDGEKILFVFEGDSEEQLADSLWTAICAKYALCEHGGLISPDTTTTLN